MCHPWTAKATIRPPSCLQWRPGQFCGHTREAQGITTVVTAVDKRCADATRLHVHRKRTFPVLQQVTPSIHITSYLDIASQGPVSLRLMTSQFKDIVTRTQKMKIVKCTFCGVWVQNFVWNFKGALWNFTQNFEPIHRKICILRDGINLTTYDILEIWHLKS